MLDDDAFALGLRDLVTMRLTHSRADRREVVVEIDRNGLAVIDEQTESSSGSVDALSSGWSRIKNYTIDISCEHFAKRSRELASLLRRRQLVTPPQRARVSVWTDRVEEILLAGARGGATAARAAAASDLEPYGHRALVRARVDAREFGAVIDVVLRSGEHATRPGSSTDSRRAVTAKRCPAGPS